MSKPKICLHVSSGRTCLSFYISSGGYEDRGSSTEEQTIVVLETVS